MTTVTGRLRGSLGAIVFGLLLVAFSAVIVVSALDLRGGAGTVPLLVGVPTLIGALFVLVRDLVRGTGDSGAEEADGVRAPVLETLGPGLAAVPSDEEPETPESRRRQYLFAAWVIAFVALASVTSFYVAVPVAMLVLFVAVRLSPIAIVVTIGGVLALLYGLFDLFLRVRL